MVLFASAVDALVWSYQAQRAALERQDTTLVRARPCRSHRLHGPAPAVIQRAPSLAPRSIPQADE
jgi:hypothetical protein